MEKKLVVEAIKIQDVNAYQNYVDENLKYYIYYVDCPYCNAINELGRKDDRGYYICGQCNKVFYLR